MNIKEVLLKEPFKRITPNPTLDLGMGITDGRMQQVSTSDDLYEIISQDTFLREYFVSGHKIFDASYYMDRIKKTDKGESYIHYVERVGIPFQKVITTKRLTHLCGNNIEFKAEGGDENILMKFKEGWISKNMEVAWFKAAKSQFTTGDCAFCGYFDRSGKFRWKIFSYAKGDILYPHFDPISGEVDIFGRKYKQTDENGDTVDFVDVYDSQYVTTYKRSVNGRFIRALKNLIGTWQEWEQVGEAKLHGFPFCPIAYHRDEYGACWTPVQDLIDKLEIAISQLAENNKSYAFRILFLQGESVDVKMDSSGMPTAITGDKDSNAKFLEKADISNSFETQIRFYLQWIFMGSFTVMPPEVKSGDLPGVAIKLIYSPAVEQAMEESQEWDGFIDDMVRIFKTGYGREIGMTAQFDNLPVRGEIIPYIHQNDAEVINNLNSSVLAGTLSVKTASSKHPEASPGEYDLIEKEKKMELESGAGAGRNIYNEAEEIISNQ